MEKVTRNRITKRDLETIILGEIQAQTDKKYNESKTYLMQTFTKERIDKIANEKGSFTKVNAKTITIEELIEMKEAQMEKLQEEIVELKLKDKTEIVIIKNEYCTRYASPETKEKAREYIGKRLADFTSKTLKQ